MSTPTSNTARKYRGKTKAGRNWKYDGDLAVIPLELGLSGDPAMLARLCQQWAACFSLERAIKNDARKRVRAFDEWKSGWRYRRLPKNQRGAACKTMQAHLGLSQDALTQAAYQHIEKSIHLRHYVTKAQALHHASAVWEATSRHLYPDRAGGYFGPPKVGSWWDFTRMVGRARSHTKPRVWETFRLMGSLQGHLNTYGTGIIAGKTVSEVRARAPSLTGTTLLDQPATMHAPATPMQREGGWWLYDGPLVVVFSGLPGGDLRLPVRLPSGAGSFDRLAHFLADKDSWHKIDLVRVRDRHAPAGWRFNAHLTVLKAGYRAPSTLERQAAVPTNRLAGIDANVSNIAAFSGPSRTTTDGDAGSLEVTIVKPDTATERAALKAARKTARTSAYLDRSRRAANRNQYELSKPQQARAERRATCGLPPKTVDVPKGRRVSTKAGRPLRAYRKDALTTGYRKARADHATATASTVARKKAAATSIAADLVAVHGNRWTTEDVSIAAWQHTWGKRLAVTTPGRILTALKREIEATGGTWQEIPTQATWLSQRCICGRREKKPLSMRWHSCPVCGLQADRDVLAAALATTVIVPDPNKPSMAFVDQSRLGALARRITAQQEERVRSTITLASPGGDGSRHRTASAGHNDSPGQPSPRQPRKGTPCRRKNSRQAPALRVPDL